MNEELFKDYVPEILVYDPKVDGSYEHKIRDEHLDVKEYLLKKIRSAKNKAKEKVNGTKAKFRQPIRTENEE
jgi:hypothetical protein